MSLRLGTETFVLSDFCHILVRRGRHGAAARLRGHADDPVPEVRRMRKAERAPGRRFSLREATPAAGAPLSIGSSFLLLLLLILSVMAERGREAVLMPIGNLTLSF